MTAFTYRSARSGSILFALGMVIVVETLVLHVWLGARHPLIAWALTTASIVTLLWLAADYRAMGRGAVRIADDTLTLEVGRRFTVQVPRDTIATATRPSWRDIPAASTAAAADYLNLMKPGTPNVLLTLSGPAVVRLPGGLRRSVRRLGLHLDDPDAFLVALNAPAPGTTNPAGAARV